MKELFYPLLISLQLFTIVSTTAQQTINGNFVYDGRNRTYRLYVPESYNSIAPAPLIMNLHGYGSSNIEQEFYGDFRPIADTAGFLLVHPNGTLDFTNTMHWNTFGTSSVDDVGFLSALIDTIAAHYNVNLERVYSTGMSNGGFMSFSLACELSDRIAAIASVTGTMIPTKLAACNPLRPVPVMQIHGTADGTVPYNGNLFFVPVQSILNFWITHNGCAPTPIITMVPDLDPTDGCTAENYLYANGTSGSTVEHYKIIGGGHSWPGAPININITNMDFSASQEIWRFFSQYDLNGLITSISSMAYDGGVVEVYPNPAHGFTKLQFPDYSYREIAIFNAFGSLIETFSCSCDNITVTFPANGLFLIKVSENGLTTTLKVLNRQ